jgi:hypothetical protein
VVRLGSFAAHKVTQGAEDASSKPQSCEHAPNGRPFCIWLQRVDPPGRARQKVGARSEPIGTAALCCHVHVSNRVDRCPAGCRLGA